MNKDKVYNLQVNGEHDFSLTPEEIEKMDILDSSGSEFHLLENHKSYKAKLVKKDFDNKSYQVEINGNGYNIKITNDLDRLIKELGFEVGTGAKVNEIYSPMPGLIFDIMISEGDQVSFDQPLLILEAMKMENIISSPREGTISKIAVTRGQAIEKKTLLIEFE